uniref:Uncharacterized protein n=1 Tax=Alexandrium catenella TaxID=2925 RepID=A0A7S1R372_ALECA|mmetsp:Transcript_43663/g.117786  ORF Transcript_43663/g.117786 Transcript_43663/m.117786 type:complete len:772 (+) Transcript_43663:61-2376(+)
MARSSGSRALAILVALMPAAWHASAARAVRQKAGASASSGASMEMLGAAGGKAHDTPVTRVVSLLTAMQVTLKKDMDEDEALYDKLKCWCQSGKSEKEAASAASGTKIGELTSTIEGFTAKGSELKATIKDLESGLASDKKALAEATAVREKEQKESHGSEVDSIQAIENLKAAVAVLSKHEAAPESSVGGGAIFKTAKDSFESLLALKSVTTSEDTWTKEHEASHLARPLEEFMRRSGFEDAEATRAAEALAPPPPPPASGGFLQGEAQAAEGAAAGAALSLEETVVVQSALRSASSFMQARHGSAYYPAYNAQSGEILGVLKQLKEEMESDLKEAQEREQARGSGFGDLRSAKSDEIQNAEKMDEQKEDELATAENKLAEAKEDLKDEEMALAETQKFLGNLQATCADADKNFEERKAARMTELKAVTDAVEVLMKDEARDAMSSTYSLLQRRSSARASQRQRAAASLRSAARRARDPQLSLLAASVELDAFVKVKAAIDKMVGMLKVQQEDEVKKNDWCKAEIHSNEMSTEKKEGDKADLEAKDSLLESDIKTMEAEIADAKAQVAQLQLDLQQAGKGRQAENLEYQKTVQDQVLTIQALKKALARLQTYYKADAAKSAALLERAGQAPPVPQMKYAPSKAAGGIMQLIEKLIQDAKTMAKDAEKSEVQAQAAYEQTVEDTNAAVAALQKEVSTKSKAKAKAAKEKLQTESDIADTATELDGLSKVNTQLHAECDYVLKNFNTRQEARAEEIEALQQAKQILRGATAS